MIAYRSGINNEESDSLEEGTRTGLLKVDEEGQRSRAVDIAFAEEVEGGAVLVSGVLLDLGVGSWLLKCTGKLHEEAD